MAENHADVDIDKNIRACLRGGASIVYAKPVYSKDSK